MNNPTQKIANSRCEPASLDRDCFMFLSIATTRFWHVMPTLSTHSDTVTDPKVPKPYSVGRIQENDRIGMHYLKN